MKDGYKDIYPASVEPGNLDSPTGLDEIRPGRLKQSLSLYSTMSPAGYSPGRIIRFDHHWISNPC